MKILIVGGGRGLGRAIGIHLAGRRHEVGILARTSREVDETVQACRDVGATARPLVADVLDPATLKTAVRKFADLACGLDALVYSAGRFRAVGPLAAVDPDDWWLDVATTLRGFALAVRETAPLLRSSATPSITALVGPGHAGELAFGAGYGSAQAGLVRLVESLDLELQPQHAPVYAVNPGLVQTAMIGELLDGPEGRRWLRRFTEAFAEGKEVGPDRVAETVAWLVEDRPPGLGGRVVPSLLGPDFLGPQIERVVADDRGRLRLR